MNQFPFETGASDSVDGGKESTALLELRDFLASELDAIGTTNQLDRALKPLTDGLGLDSPKDAVRQNLDFVVRKSSLQVSALAPTVSDDRTGAKKSEPAPPPESAAEVTVPRMPSVILNTQDAAIQMAPPPLPKVGFFRRFCAGVLDQLFVLSLFLLAMGLTLKMLTSGGSITLEAIKQTDTPLLIRFAVLEFASLWLAYLTICLGILDATFGMWVWGIRLNYPKDRLGSVLGRKGLRVVGSFFLFAPLIPTVLLAFRFKGRNLLDHLSGTSVYRTVF